MKNIALSLISAICLLCSPTLIQAQHVTKIKYGDFDSWITRNIKESRVLGGKVKKVYAIGPTAVLGSTPYTGNPASPWATSNVMAKVMGVTKGSNAVYPGVHEGHGKCARLCTEMEHCEAAGLVSMDVVVAGTVFLGNMIEPIKSTKNPYSKMEMGVPYTDRPVALVFDYKLEIPGNNRIYSSGFGSQKEMPGADKAEALILLQRRWEDEDGNIYAKRVGTGRELFGASTANWVNGHKVNIHYGDAASVYPLIPKGKSYYAKNRKGRMMPVQEVGWDAPDAAPTHMIVMFSSGSGAPYTGTLGTEFCIDDVGLMF